MTLLHEAEKLAPSIIWPRLLALQAQRTDVPAVDCGFPRLPSCGDRDDACTRVDGGELMRTNAIKRIRRSHELTPGGSSYSSAVPVLFGNEQVSLIWGRLIVLERFLRRTEEPTKMAAQPLSPPSAPNPCSHPPPILVVPNCSTRPAVHAVTPKRRRNSVRVDGLYLEREPENVRHARALLELIQDECPEKVGKYIPHTHLDRTYRELCEREAWTARTWAAIARPLGRMTRKRLVKRDGRRFIAYGIPAPH